MLTPLLTGALNTLHCQTETMAVSKRMGSSDQICPCAHFACTHTHTADSDRVADTHTADSDRVADTHTLLTGQDG